MNRFGAGTGGDVIGFTGVASRAPLVAWERKICEYCGAGFMRPVPTTAKLGAKYCAGCQVRLTVGAESVAVPRYSRDKRVVTKAAARVQ